jgi:uncharacterized protein (DUF983 family)
MGKFDRFCQSCGMPMEKDTENGGPMLMVQRLLSSAVIVIHWVHLMTNLPDQKRW